MRRIILKYDSNLNLLELSRYCIKETQHIKGQGELILILTEEGFKYCSENFNPYIVKSNKVDLYNVNVFAENTRSFKEIFNKFPYNETVFRSPKSEYLVQDNLFGFNFSIYLTESEAENLLFEIDKYVFLNKVKGIVRCNCVTTLEPLFINNFLTKCLKGSGGLYSLNLFENLSSTRASNNRGMLFDLYIDANKIDMINTHKVLKINSINLCVDYRV